MGNLPGMVNNLILKSLENNNFREVIFTGKHSQIVLMSLKPKEEIGLESHSGHDQFIFIVKGTAEIIIDSVKQISESGFGILIPDNVKHNVINLSETEELKLFTLYSPPEHIDGKIDINKP